MINCKSWVLECLDDRSVGVGQLCVFSNQGYSHVFQKTIRSKMRCSSNYLIALKKEPFKVKHFHTCQPSLSTLWAFSWDSSLQTCSDGCRSSSQPPVLPARGVLCKWRRRPGHRSPKNDGKRYSFSHSKKHAMNYFYNVITCIKILYLWRLHMAKHRDFLFYHCFQGRRTATHNLITIRTTLLVWVGGGVFLKVKACRSN